MLIAIPTQSQRLLLLRPLQLKLRKVECLADSLSNVVSCNDPDCLSYCGTFFSGSEKAFFIGIGGASGSPTCYCLPDSAFGQSTVATGQCTNSCPGDSTTFCGDDSSVRGAICFSFGFAHTDLRFLAFHYVPTLTQSSFSSIIFSCKTFSLLCQYSELPPKQMHVRERQSRLQDNQR